MKPTLLILLIALPCFGQIDEQRMANAIKRVENSQNYPYGQEIRSNGVLHGFPEAEARARCLAMIRRSNALWEASGRQSGLTGCISSLSTTYCPANSNNWARMVSFYYRHPERIK